MISCSSITTFLVRKCELYKQRKHDYSSITTVGKLLTTGLMSLRTAVEQQQTENSHRSTTSPFPTSLSSQDEICQARHCMTV